MRKFPKIKALKDVFVRECKRIVSRPLYLLGIIGIPLFCFFFFPSLMEQGLPQDIPIGIVDSDNSSISRSLTRNLDVMSQTQIIANYSSVLEAREAVQCGEIYGFYYIPKDFSRDIRAQRQPTLSFYTNNMYLVPGSLLFKDMKQLSELASAAVNQKILRAKGVSEEKILADLQPIVIDAHTLNNPWLNYSVYLNNIIIPGVLSLLIFMMTVYAIGVELKDDTAREWLKIGKHSVTLSLTGKLLPQTLLFFLMGVIYNVYLYGYLNFPENSGTLPMFLATLFFVLASQACGIFMIALLPSVRLGLSFASLWGMISFSISGFSFPSIGMFPVVQALSNLFPLRYYYLIYVSQALNGYPMVYAWHNYIYLLIFMLLPFVIGKRLKKALIYYKYIP